MRFFSLTLLSETFLNLRRTKEHVSKKCILVFVYSTCYYCQILMKLEFYRQVFEKYSNIKFHENPFRGNRSVPCERTDGQLIVNFLNSADATKNSTFCQQRMLL